LARQPQVLNIVTDDVVGEPVLLVSYPQGYRSACVHATSHYPTPHHYEQIPRRFAVCVILQAYRMTMTVWKTCTTSA